MEDQRLEYERLIAPIEDRMMRAVWHIIRDPAEAEDAFQEALLAIWKHWEQVRRHPNPHALILRMCINSAHDMLRRKMRRSKWLEEEAVAEELRDFSTSVEEKISNAEQDAQVVKALGKLSGNQAQALVMHVVEKMPYSDIALTMNCGEATVRKHAERARAKLRLLLSHLMSPAHKEEGIHA